jgi:hypothetical protein
MGRGSEQAEQRVGAVSEAPKRVVKPAVVVEIKTIDAGPRLHLRWEGVDIVIERGQPVPLPKNAILLWK